MGMISQLRSPRLLRGFALASVIANVVLVVTGGAVRLTSSGLGCPTWPTCTASSLTPVPEYRWHGLVEFGNRMLTFGLVAIAVATVVLAILQHTERGLALLAFAGIPAQAVLGGLSVLTGLNPYVVAAHFLLSMLLVAVTMLLWHRVRLATGSLSPPLPSPSPVRWLAAMTAAVTAAVLVVGTVVTGSGPHAGDRNVPRMGFSPAAVSQLHADLVMILIGLSVGLVVILRLTGASHGARNAAWMLLLTEGLQAVIGYTQYFLGVPAALVGLHMLGACLVWVSAIAVALHLQGPRALVGVPVDERIPAISR